jgi:hypothetical protein
MVCRQFTIYDLRFTRVKFAHAQIANRKSKIRMTRHCHNCGEEWTLTGQPGRGENCMRCRADLRVCLNCAHHDPRAAQQCRERRAEPVLEKHAGNFCEYFEFARRVWTPKDGDTRREAAAREQLKKLFGD